MPYTTERGVTTYSDRDTPPEYADSADEERAAYNEAFDEAFAFGETLIGLLDDLIEPPTGVSADQVRAIGNKVHDLNLEIAALLKR